MELPFLILVYTVACKLFPYNIRDFFLLLYQIVEINVDDDDGEGHSYCMRKSSLPLIYFYNKMHIHYIWIGSRQFEPFDMTQEKEKIVSNVQSTLILHHLWIVGDLRNGFCFSFSFSFSAHFMDKEITKTENKFNAWRCVIIIILYYVAKKEEAHQLFYANPSWKPTINLFQWIMCENCVKCAWISLNLLCANTQLEVVNVKDNNK